MWREKEANRGCGHAGRDTDRQIASDTARQTDKLIKTPLNRWSGQSHPTRSEPDSLPPLPLRRELLRPPPVLQGLAQRHRRGEPVRRRPKGRQRRLSGRPIDEECLLSYTVRFQILGFNYYDCLVCVNRDLFHNLELIQGDAIMYISQIRYKNALSHAFERIKRLRVISHHIFLPLY